MDQEKTGGKKLRSKYQRKQISAGLTNESDSTSRHPTVVFVYPYVQHNRDAVGACVEQLSQHLSDSSKFRGRIFCVDDKAALASRIRTGNTTIQRAARAYDQILFLWRTFFYLVSLRDEPNLFVITVDAPTGIGIPVQLAKWRRPKITHIAWVMDLYRLRSSTKRSILSELRGSIELQTLAKADHVVTLGECMRNNLASVTDRNVTVIPIWQDESWLQPASDTDPNQESRRPIDIVYSGSARAGIHPLAQLAQAVLTYDAPDELRLIVRGQGDEIDHLKDVVSPNSHTVLFEQPVAHSDVPETLARADIHLVSLASEATGTCVPSKTYAAMAVGRPLLYVGDSAGQAARDILEGKCGYVVAPGVSMQDVFERIVNSATELNRLGASGRSYFLKNRSMSAVGARWTSFLEEVEAHDCKSIT